jgi:hypothetical protein
MSRTKRTIRNVEYPDSKMTRNPKRDGRKYFGETSGDHKNPLAVKANTHNNYSGTYMKYGWPLEMRTRKSVMLKQIEEIAETDVHEAFNEFNNF